MAKGCGKTGDISDHAATDSDNNIVSRKAKFGKFLCEHLNCLKALVFFTVADHHCCALNF